MSESMVERVAKAIYGERYEVEIAFGAMPAWEGLDSYDRQSQFDEARAAIEAMREPTEAMVKAARQHHEGDAYLPHSLFNSMIDAALEEGKQ